MNAKEYQEAASTFACYPEAGTGSAACMDYLELGLIGESGELCDKVKKTIRGDSYGCSREGKLLELGDIAWYLSELCRALRVDFAGVYEDSTACSMRDLSEVKEEDLVAGLALAVGAELFELGGRKFDFVEILAVWSFACRFYDSTPEGVWQMNIDKLTARKKNGTIKGSGDDR